MLDQFLGRHPGDHAYLECTLATDLSNDWEGEAIPTHKQVDVKLPNGKLLRLPYSWLRAEPEVKDEAPSEVLNGMLDATEEDENPSPPKKVAVRRAPPK